MSADNEQWRLIPRLPDYEVSNLGRVRRITPSRRGGRGKPGTILRPNKRKDGYLFLFLNTPSGGRLTVRVHRAVCEAFIGPYSPGQETHHINGIKDDNRLSNLMQVSQRVNSALAWSIGENERCRCRGSRNGWSRLQEDQVIEIKNLLLSGVAPKDIAERLGVSRSLIYDIRRGKTWAWL